MTSLHSKGAKTELKVPAYRGLGTVLVVVVSIDRGPTSGGITQASYVPVVTYSCDGLPSDCVEEGECQSTKPCVCP